MRRCSCRPPTYDCASAFSCSPRHPSARSQQHQCQCPPGASIGGPCACQFATAATVVTCAMVCCRVVAATACSRHARCAATLTARVGGRAAATYAATTRWRLPAFAAIRSCTGRARTARHRCCDAAGAARTTRTTRSVGTGASGRRPGGAHAARTALAIGKTLPHLAAAVAHVAAGSIGQKAVSWALAVGAVALFCRIACACGSATNCRLSQWLATAVLRSSRHLAAGLAVVVVRTATDGVAANTIDAIAAVALGPRLGLHIHWRHRQVEWAPPTYSTATAMVTGSKPPS